MKIKRLQFYIVMYIALMVVIMLIKWISQELN